MQGTIALPAVDAHWSGRYERHDSTVTMLNMVNETIGVMSQYASLMPDPGDPGRDHCSGVVLHQETTRAGGAAWWTG
jgi:hypothetical protein